MIGNRTELKLFYVHEIMKLNYSGAVEATSWKIAGSITDGVTGIFH